MVLIDITWNHIIIIIRNILLIAAIYDASMYKNRHRIMIKYDDLSMIDLLKIYDGLHHHHVSHDEKRFPCHDAAWRPLQRRHSLQR